ncbi:MAG: hypothetical protein HND56_10865 [Pseudomonadota bacterium]|nr:hypothetical protein [Pseudomonadota bacterium]QKK06155.1 MAG: hypothetical protein HND56_10865 [Pseudomonadota bacterium]
MQEQDPRHQKAAMTRTQLAMLMLMGAAFSSLMATIGFAVIKMSWIGNAGLILTLLLVCDAVLLLRNGRSFFALEEQPYSWFYDFRYELEQRGAKNIPQEIRLELERKKHARYIVSAGGFLIFIHFSIPVVILSLALMGYGGWRCIQHYNVLAAYFTAPAEAPET